MKFIQQVQDSLEAINGYRQPLMIQDFIIPSRETDQLIIKEGQDEAEILICLRESRLQTLSGKNFPTDFEMQLLPDLSVVIEELSHFNTYSLSASAGREVSAVELEVQGEVDKFSVALDYLHQLNEDALAESVFEILFDRCELAPWVPVEDEQRYRDAHDIARNFCRRVLKNSAGFEARRTDFREFYISPRLEKLGPKFGG